MSGTTPFPRPYLAPLAPFAPFAPYFSLESRYRCATKQRDEGSWTKTRHGLALVGANQSMGSRFSEDCRHPHDCPIAQKRVWMAPMGACMAESYTQILPIVHILLLRPLRFNTLPYSLTLVSTHARTHRSLTSVLFLGATAGRPGGKSPGGN